MRLDLLHVLPLIRGQGGSEFYIFEGSESQPKIADFFYHYFPIEIKAEDQQRVMVDAGHVCQPIVNVRRSQKFGIRKGTEIRSVLSDLATVFLHRGQEFPLDWLR